MKIVVHHFAVLRERVGADAETYETDSVASPGLSDPAALWRAVEARHGLGIDPASFAVAVNDGVSGWDHPLSDGDEVVFLPPVSGGGR